MTASAWAVNGVVQMHGVLSDLTPGEARALAGELLAAADHADLQRSVRFVSVDGCKASITRDGRMRITLEPGVERGKVLYTLDRGGR